MNRKVRIFVEVLSHILLWVIPTYLFIRYDLMSFGELTGRYFRLPLIISVLINILIVYSNIFILFPALARKRIKLLLYAFILITVVILTAFLKVKIDNIFMLHYFSELTTGGSERIGFELVINLFFAVQSLLYCIVREWIRTRIIERRLSEEKLSLELRFLKSQINPHFLFNTLNNLYSLALKNNDEETAAGITRLSQMMRFMLDEVDENMIPLEKEISYLHSYIELQKLRFSEKDDIRISFMTQGDASAIKVPPFIFIVFIENAFKHGIDYEKPSFIDMKLVAGYDKLSFSVVNSFHGRSDNTGQGIGLRNVRERLEMIYSDNFNLEISASDNTFNVGLIIRLSGEQ